MVVPNAIVTMAQGSEGRTPRLWMSAANTHGFNLAKPTRLRTSQYFSASAFRGGMGTIFEKTYGRVPGYAAEGEIDLLAYKAKVPGELLSVEAKALLAAGDLGEVDG